VISTYQTTSMKYQKDKDITKVTYIYYWLKTIE